AAAGPAYRKVSSDPRSGTPRPSRVPAIAWPARHVVRLWARAAAADQQPSPLQGRTRMDRTPDNHSLAVLGITATEERIYRFLVGCNGATQSQLAAALSLGKRASTRALEQLELSGLVRHSPESPRRYF